MSSRKLDKVDVIDQVTELDDDMLEKLYCWVDELPLSRPKKNMARDFSDGVLVAEIMKSQFPRYVEMHNYVAANASDKKVNNWNVLNRKVLKKINLEVSPKVIKALVDCKPFAAECVLSAVREHIDMHLAQQMHAKESYENQMYDPWMSQTSEQPEADQNRGNFPGPSGHHQNFQPMNDTHSIYSHAPHPPAPPVPQAGNSNKPPWLGKTPPKKPPGGKKGDSLPKKVLEEKEQELQVKNETIEILQAKIQRLEHLLNLKDIRIEDLTARVEHLEQQFANQTLAPAGGGRGRGRSPQRNSLQHRPSIQPGYGHPQNHR